MYRKQSGRILNQKQCESEVVQSCLTLCDPMDGHLPSSSVHGIFQARVLEWERGPGMTQGVPPSLVLRVGSQRMKLLACMLPDQLCEAGLWNWLCPPLRQASFMQAVCANLTEQDIVITVRDPASLRSTCS